MTSQSSLDKLRSLVELGQRMRATDKAAADAWNQPTDAEHDRLSLEADHLFEEFGHAAEAALPELSALLSQVSEPVALPPVTEFTMADNVPPSYDADGQYAWKAGWNACVKWLQHRELPEAIHNALFARLPAAFPPPSQEKK